MDKIILSCNENKQYYPFWKYVSWAYKKIFPNVEVHLAFLTQRSEDDEMVIQMRKSGLVTLFEPIKNISEFTQAKFIRFYLASQQGDKVCYIDDVDIFPLSKKFIEDAIQQRPKDHILCVGGEVYINTDSYGTYPISQMTAEGYIWKKLINPKSLPLEDLLNELADEPIMFNKKENPKISPRLYSFVLSKNYLETNDWFSDEALMRRLLHKSDIKKFELARGYSDISASTLDRYHNIPTINNLEKLNNHQFVNYHCTRIGEVYDNDKMIENEEQLKQNLQPLIDYINKFY